MRRHLRPDRHDRHNDDRRRRRHRHRPHPPAVHLLDPRPGGKPRLVTSAASYGQVVSETNLVIDKRTGEVDRARSTSTNHLVSRTAFAKDATQTGIIAKWNTLAGDLGQQVVGSNTEDITR